MDEEVLEGAVGPSTPGEPEDSGGPGSEMDPEDEVIETTFFEKLHGLMYTMDIQEKVAFTEQEQPEYESTERFLQINPPIPIKEKFFSEPSDGEVTIGIGIDTPTYELDFLDDLSENERNFIDQLLIEYVRERERTTPQCSVPASTDIKAGEIVSTGSSAKETSGDVTSEPQIVSVNPIKDDAGATSDNGNKPTTSFEPPQSTSDIKTEDEVNRGKVFDDNNPLTDLPQYFDKIIEINGKRFVQKSRLLCFIQHDIISMEEEGKESGKQKHAKDSVPSPCEEQGTVSKNKKKRRKAKKTNRDRKQDCTESISNTKDASASCPNVGPAKDSDVSSMPEFECDAKNKVVEETSETTGIPDSKDGGKGANESDAKKVEETLETKDVSDSKDDEKGPIEDDANNKVVKKTSDPKEIPDSKGDEKDAIESDAKKVEETLETKDASDSKDDEKCPIKDDAKNKVVEEALETKDVSDSKDDEKDAIESDAKKVEETLETKDASDSKDDEKGPIEETLETKDVSDSKDDEKCPIKDDAKNKVVEEALETKDVSDSKDDEKDAIESDAKKVEETLETKDVSDSNDDEKCPIEDDAKNKAVEETSESKDIQDLKDNEKGPEEEPSRLKQENTAANNSQTSKSRKKKKKKSKK